MKKLLTLILCFAGFGVSAQENPLNKGLSFGFQLNQYQKDFGFGLNATSPLFLKDHVAIRLRSNLMYLEHLQNEEITWTPYSNVSLGIMSVGGYLTDFLKLYGEGGVIGILPNNRFSTKDVAMGGYGLFGFEFFMQNGFNYFIEIGGIGTGATADKIATKPIYSNGLSVSTGFRVVLP